MTIRAIKTVTVTLWVLLGLGVIQAQTNSMKWCTQEATANCVTLGVPSTSPIHNPSRINFWGKSGGLLVGIPSTDLNILTGAVVSPDAFVSVTAQTDASVGAFAATAGIGVDISSGKTGIGTQLPIRFMMNPIEAARILPNGEFLVGRTATDTTASKLQVLGNLSVDGAVGAKVYRIVRGTPGTGMTSFFDWMHNAGNNNMLDLQDAIAQVLIHIDNTRIASANMQMSVAGDLFPFVHDTYSLGNTGTRWKNLWVSGNANVGGVLTVGSCVGCGTGSGTAAGGTGSVQFNTSGAFDADTGLFTYDKSNHRLLMGLSSTGVGTSSGSIVTSGTYVTVTAPTDASVGSLGVIAGNYVALSSNANGTGTVLPLAIFTGGAEVVRVTATGTVGIGTTSPAGKLHVTDSFYQIRAYYTGTQQNVFMARGNGFASIQSQTDGVSYDLLKLNTNGGSVMIGADSFSNVQLTVAGATGAGAINTSAALGGALALDDGGGSAGNGGAVIFGAASGAWRFASIKGFVTDGTANSAGDLLFSTRTGTSNTTLTEAMRIQSSGRVGFGVSTPQTTTDINGFVRVSGFGNAPTSGQGVEIFSTGASGYFRAYDRTSGLYGTTLLEGNPILLNGALNGYYVGIGMASPGFTLDVKGFSWNVLRLGSTDTSANHVQLRFYGAKYGNDTWVMGTDIVASNGGQDFSIISMSTGGKFIATFLPNGTVGFNTSSPQTPLSVIPTTNPTSMATAKLFSVGEQTNTAGYHVTIGYFHNGIKWQGSIQSWEGGNPSSLIISGNGGYTLFGMSTTDLSLLTGAVVSANAFVTVTSTANASTGSFAAVAGNYVALASAVSGGGTYLPLTFWTSATERMRIDINGHIAFKGNGTPTVSGAGCVSPVVTGNDIRGNIVCAGGMSSTQFFNLNFVNNYVNLPHCVMTGASGALGGVGFAVAQTGSAVNAATFQEYAYTGSSASSLRYICIE